MKPKDRVYICINGILTRNEDIDAWNDRLAAWIDVHTPYKATVDKYFSTVFLRFLGQPARVHNLLKLIERYSDFDIVLVGHSNGCDVIVRALNHLMEKSAARSVLQAHLFAAAAEVDFDRNGMNKVLRSLTLNTLFLYGSYSDSVLRLAKQSYGWLLPCFRYGYLGLDGPQNVASDVLPNVARLWMPWFDHSTWWMEEGGYFERTARMIVGAPAQA